MKQDLFDFFEYELDAKADHFLNKKQLLERI